MHKNKIARSADIKSAGRRWGYKGEREGAIQRAVFFKPLPLIDKENRLTQENFICKECGFKLNADHNASINIARSEKFIK